MWYDIDHCVRGALEGAPRGEDEVGIQQTTLCFVVLCFSYNFADILVKPLFTILSFMFHKGYHELPRSSPQVVLPQIASSSQSMPHHPYIPQEQSPIRRPHQEQQKDVQRVMSPNILFMGLAQSEAVYLGGILTLLAGLVLIFYCLPLKVSFNLLVVVVMMVVIVVLPSEHWWKRR